VVDLKGYMGASIVAIIIFFVYRISGSILLALSFRVKKVKKYVAYYLPVAARILFLIP